MASSAAASTLIALAMEKAKAQGATAADISAAAALVAAAAKAQRHAARQDLRFCPQPGLSPHVRTSRPQFPQPQFPPQTLQHKALRKAAKRHLAVQAKKRLSTFLEGVQALRCTLFWPWERTSLLYA
jgi:hypothetical protein